MKQLVIEKECLGYPICARIDIPAEGLAVLLTGGCKPHIGAVSSIEPGQEVLTTQFTGHREGVISQQWAQALCSRYNTPTVVSCGIHYNNLSREGINEVLDCSFSLLQEVFTSIDRINR